MSVRGPDEIRWLGADTAPRALPCPVCHDAGPHAPVLAVPTMAESGEELVFLRCRACASGFYDPPGVVDFAEIGHAGAAFWRFYVEVGGGVWETIWPILAVAGTPGRSLLDIGCGFGYAVDYWGRETGGEAVGVELASYGRIGAEQLGIVVHDRLLEDIAELEGRHFDVVYASEVVEHVPDPTAFVALLANYVADDGVLVLTTPAMSFIAPEHASSTLLAALAPGFHGFLLSSSAFASAARRAGFSNVEVRTYAERQILWASRRPFALDATLGRLHPAYLAYLDRRVEDGDPATPVWQGLAYRAVKARVNRSRPAEGRELARRLLDAVAAAFGEHVRDPAATLARIEAAPDLSTLGESIPYFLPSFYYYLGMIALQVDRDAAAGLRWLEGAVACTTAAARIQAALFLEAGALVWPARTAIAEVAIAMGDVARGVRELVALCREGDIPSGRHAFALADPDLIERRAPATVSLLVERGHGDAARAVAAAHAEYVARRYGDELLTPQGVERAIDAKQPSPADPTFAPWIAALFDLADGRPGAATRALAVADLAERLAPRRRDASALRSRSAALRRRLSALSVRP